MELAAASGYEREFRILADFLIVIEYFDFSASTESTRLYDPQILRTVHIGLWIILSEVLDQAIDIVVYVLPPRELALLFGLKFLILIKMVANFFVHLEEPFFFPNELNVRLRILTLAQKCIFVVF